MSGRGDPDYGPSPYLTASFWLDAWTSAGLECIARRRGTGMHETLVFLIEREAASLGIDKETPHDEPD